MLNKIKSEPALVVGAVVAVLAVAVAFGAPISNAQTSAIVGGVNAVLALLGALVVRTKVTPTAKAAATAPAVAPAVAATTEAPKQ